MTDIQKAAYSKRLFAFLADAILVAIITSGLFFVFSAVSGIDSHSAKYTEIIKSYEDRYGVTFGLSNEEYEKLTPEAKSNYKTAVDAANSDARIGVQYINGSPLYGRAYSIDDFPCIERAVHGENAISYCAGEGLMFAMPAMR